MSGAFYRPCLVQAGRSSGIVQRVGLNWRFETDGWTGLAAFCDPGGGTIIGSAS